MLVQKNAAPVHSSSPELMAVERLVATPHGSEHATSEPERPRRSDDRGRDRRRQRQRHADPYLHVLKPAFDRTAALVALVVTAPIMAASAVAIRVAMGRGVIFTQVRVGRGGRPFRMYKFRTMRPDRRRRSVPVPVERRMTHKHPNDPRLTRVGRFLRKWSLDELPQFVNVLRGDMSLVGPRPEMVDIVNRYEHWQHGRHVVKPGLTGLWQISDRGDQLMHECVERDLEYILRLSSRTDLSILLRTPAAMLGSRRGF